MKETCSIKLIYKEIFTLIFFFHQIHPFFFSKSELLIPVSIEWVEIHIPAIYESRNYYTVDTTNISQSDYEARFDYTRSYKNRKYEKVKSIAKLIPCKNSYSKINSNQSIFLERENVEQVQEFLRTNDLIKYDHTISSH